MNTRPAIGLTMGDPAGVGPELCVRALSNPDVLRLCQPVVFGSLDVLKLVSAAINLPLPAGLQFTNAERGMRNAEWAEGVPAVVNCKSPAAESIQPGKVSPECGAAGFEFIRTAIEWAMTKRITGVATAPINKESLRLAGVQYPGHTEIFTVLTGSKRTCMMLRSDVLTVSMVTTHIGYAEVPQRISTQRIVDVIELTADAITRMNSRPARLAICGLNPHAGEHGLFGNREEEQFVEPAVAQARAKGISIEGPLPPDTAFTTANRKRFDGVVCLYHDQGHIPFKMLAFDDGVNLTLGLPIVRASVDHGTAFDIAWTGVANPMSFYKSIEFAVKLGGSGK